MFDYSYTIICFVKKCETVKHFYARRYEGGPVPPPLRTCTPLHSPIKGAVVVIGCAGRWPRIVYTSFVKYVGRSAGRPPTRRAMNLLNDVYSRLLCVSRDIPVACSCTHSLWMVTVRVSRRCAEVCKLRHISVRHRAADPCMRGAAVSNKNLNLRRMQMSRPPRGCSGLVNLIGPVRSSCPALFCNGADWTPTELESWPCPAEINSDEMRWDEMR